jgi:hypothetical protein
MKFDKIYNKVLTKILDEVNAISGGGVAGHVAPLKFKEEDIKEEETEETKVNKKIK